ncbi:transcription elongation factor GreB [Psychromonas sp. CNPT3]|uniref:transcription elongation factor GreB n=1 Tax=Psychromonas sp. CNPT3 TaxID=314282 RepID=UPI00006E762B|nr:transcription elongation factor GreB [Psychromonas sp. CNPT3]AGH80330.1 transcription elongation factor GreB [Psychromonas sp. CNPT3]
MRTNLITPEGFKTLQTELEHLWREYRPEITRKVTWAASLGDRSDNADYKENKRILRQIDSRIRFLTKRLQQVSIISPSKQQANKVFFGAKLSIENDEGEIKNFKIVGPDEIYQRGTLQTRKDYISIDSPMARALLKLEVDDEAQVKTPTGIQTWYILTIDYDF